MISHDYRQTVRGGHRAKSLKRTTFHGKSDRPLLNRPARRPGQASPAECVANLNEAYPVPTIYGPEPSQKSAAVSQILSVCNDAELFAG